MLQSGNNAPLAYIVTYPVVQGEGQWELDVVIGLFMLEAKRFEKGWLASGGKATRRKLADYLCIGKQGVGVRMTGDEVEICVASMEMVRRLPTDATALTMLHTMRDKPEQVSRTRCSCQHMLHESEAGTDTPPSTLRLDFPGRCFTRTKR